MTPFEKFQRMKHKRSVSQVQFIAVVLGTILLSIELGALVGIGIGCIAWAVMPFVE